MNCSTYLVTQASHSARPTVEVVEAAIAGGVDVVQLREKGLSARERFTVGQRVRDLTREAGVTFLVNDRVDLARALGADGVHLGDDDLPVTVARDQLGPDAIIGRSVSTVDGARAAEREGADYLGVGAVFATDSKDVSGESAEIGVDRVRAIREAVSVPIIAIGGITVENAPEVVSAGADGVAVISAITQAADPEAATRELAAAVEVPA